MDFKVPENLPSFVPIPRPTGGIVLPSPASVLLLMCPSRPPGLGQSRRRLPRGPFPALLKRGFVLKQERVAGFSGVRCGRARAPESGLSAAHEGPFLFPDARPSRPKASLAVLRERGRRGSSPVAGLPSRFFPPDREPPPFPSPSTNTATYTAGGGL